MAWMQGLVSGTIAPNGDITAAISDLRTVEGPRPTRIEEAGADPEVFDHIRHRVPGAFRTRGFLGGATAILVPFRALTWLPEPLMERLRVKYGFDRWPDEALVMLVRNTAAPAIQNSAEPAGGMAEDAQLLAEQLEEIVEVGVCREDGWVRFLLPPELSVYLGRFDGEQRKVWDAVRPDFTRQYEAGLDILPIGRDVLEGRRGVVRVGPVGDFSFLHIARLDLQGSGWRLFDTECRPGNREGGEPEWVALRRIVMVVVPRSGRNPIGFHFSNREGGLHPCGIHVALSGEALELNLTHLGRAAIEALGWIPEEETR
ncbi:hypothetical protein HY635_02665 [Candidatus Uhrbacteria bacterium]|nr:hypothetical protein [Candidatus Uhrbacteria bacterium]